MGNTTILIETMEQFNSDTGEITSHKRHRIQKSRVEPTDEFVKVSKYLNTIFAYNNIPLTLVPISLIFAQRMEFKTNIIYLLKSDKDEIAEMLGIGRDRVKTLISDCKKYDIIRATNTRGKFEVNSYLFSTGSIAETRELQAHFDFDRDLFYVKADQQNLITGATIRKAVTNKKGGQFPGQMSFLTDNNG